MNHVFKEERMKDAGYFQLVLKPHLFYLYKASDIP